MSATRYLVDTGIILHWVKRTHQAEAIDALLGLSQHPLKPLICEVSIGEMLAFSRSLTWGTEKRQTLQGLLANNLVSVDISDPRVMDEYAELSTVAKQRGWSIFAGKNDLWVGAASRATGSHLLTMDKDFAQPKHFFPDWQITIFDVDSGQPLS
jgi:tRNA(fMet)-specific endonuclease VapC